MVVKNEGRDKGFCCRYASVGSLIGWFMYREDTQNVIFVASSDSVDFVHAINKATADLQERLAMEKEFLNCMLNAMKNYSDRSASELRSEQLEKEKSYSRLDSLILFPDEKLVMASDVIKYLKKMAKARGGDLNNCNIKKILSLAIETVTEE